MQAWAEALPNALTPLTWQELCQQWGGQLEVISKPTGHSMIMPYVAKQNGRAAHGVANTDQTTMGSYPRPSSPSQSFPPWGTPAGRRSPVL
jgi:hypothetical protein